MLKAIVNTKLVMQDGIIWDGAITYEDGIIKEVGWRKDVSIPEDTEVMDAGGLYTAPGLVDIHNHGCPKWLFAEEPMECARYFLAHGVTTVLPTFYHAISKDGMIEAAEKIRTLSKEGAGKVMDGLYMEGPFMSLMGSFQNQIKWSGDIQESDYVDLIAAFGDMVRVWAIDPDRVGIEGFMAYAKAHTPQAVFAHGHSRSTFESIESLKPYGVRIRTHITDAGQCKGRAQGTPGAGGDQYAIYDPDIYAELICDETGIHVPPGLIKMIVRAKGVERICLISDHMTAGGDGTVKYKNNEEIGVWYGPDLNYDDQGKLAGSMMTLENGVRNMMTHTGYGLCHAIRMATLNPAEAVGISDKVGTLKAGKKANLIVIDDAVHIKKVILEGELAVENGEVLL